MHSSSALPICRVDWRPSRVLIAATAVIGSLSLLSLRLSALPTSIAAMLSALVVVHSVWLIANDLKRPPFTLAWQGGDAVAVLNFADRQQSLSGLTLSMRGPLAGIRGKDEAGKTHTYLWWPDTLSSAARRQLRLAGQVRKEPDTSNSVA